MNKIQMMVQRVKELYKKVGDAKAPKKKLILKGVTDIDDCIVRYKDLEEIALKNLENSLKSPVVTHDSKLIERESTKYQLYSYLMEMSIRCL